MEETELIHRCIQKDQIAWNEFVRRYAGLVWWAIENRLKKWDYLYDPHDIEEIHQNVFLALWKKNKLEQVRDSKKVSGWLIMVSGNEAVDYFRRQRAQSPPNAISIFEEIIQKDKVISIADILPSREPDPFYKTSLPEVEKILDEEINNLTAKEKIILELNVLYNKKYREIAEMLNMPVGSVSTALKNIKRRLKEQLKEKI